MVNLLRKIQMKLQGAAPEPSPLPEIHRAEQGSWVAQNVAQYDPAYADAALKAVFTKIEDRCSASQQKGALPLWEGYRNVKNYPSDVSEGAARTSNQVRTKPYVGKFMAWMVRSFKPGAIVEIGSAFGVSGMFWLAGIESNGKGTFFGFEPNQVWATVAKENLASISKSFVLTVGPFEENAAVLKEHNAKIDMAFIDAIHTPDFVLRELAVIMEHASDHCLIAFDDIDFSKEMRDMWNELKDDKRFVASFEFARIGIVELKR